MAGVARVVDQQVAHRAAGDRPYPARTWRLPGRRRRRLLAPWLV